MKRSLLAALILSCSLPVLAQPEGGPPPGIPLYQMRDEVPDTDRLNSTADASALYSNHCGYCHLENGMGTIVLMLRRMPMGEPPHTALLTNREDLTVEYVKAVVRQGKGAMPRQTRVDITDSELEKVAALLAGAKQ